jgi:hypothetical protein
MAKDDFHPGKCLPDCMMLDGGDCCPGYVRLYDAYWNLIKDVPDTELLTRVATAMWKADPLGRGYRGGVASYFTQARVAIQAMHQYQKEVK